MQNVKKFNQLLDDASKSDDWDIIKKIGRPNFEKLKSEKDKNKAITEYGQKLAKALLEHEKTTSSVDKSVRELLKFIDDARGPPQLFDCKEPLEQGDISFEDIAGLNFVKSQLETGYILPFHYPKLFPNIAKGILLYGVPGTGKTVIVRAATSQIENVAFFAPSGGEIRSKYEGGTEANITNIFLCADQYLENNPTYTAAIIFFDEFEAIAGKRGGDDRSMERSVTTLLQSMEGIQKRKNVSVIAATNYPWLLDTAVLRRFTEKIFVDIPDKQALQFLIRDALATAYSSPGMTILEKRTSIRDSEGEYNPEANFLKNIKTYGGFVDKKTSFLGGETINDMYVDDEYINTLVDKFRPIPEGQDLIKRIKSGEEISSRDKRLDTPIHIFGYSPSDVTKIIQLAIKYAATRALKRNAKKIIIEEDQKQYFVVGDEGTPLSKLSSDEAALVINFDIRRSDIETAMKDLTSTVENNEYVELLKYSRSGKT